MTSDTPPTATAVRDDYLSNPEVSAFGRWLGLQLGRPGSFPHEYRLRKGKLTWSCDSLYSAFEAYRWPLIGTRTSFQHNEARLRGFQALLRQAVQEGHIKATADACRAILDWGGVSGGNRQWIEARERNLIRVLRADAALLSRAPSQAELGASLNRFNSGFAKIYALYLEDFIIYDGRVGAALGELVSRWADITNREVIPELLRFPWGMPKEAPATRAPKRRQPYFRGKPGPFPRLSQDAGLHALWAIRASWLLKRILEDARSGFSEQKDPLRALEAALFMIGYDLGP